MLPRKSWRPSARLRLCSTAWALSHRRTGLETGHRPELAGDRLPPKGGLPAQPTARSESPSGTPRPRRAAASPRHTPLCGHRRPAPRCFRKASRGGPALSSPRFSALTQPADPLTALPRGGKSVDGGGHSARTGAVGRPKWLYRTLRPSLARGKRRAPAARLHRCSVAGLASCRHPLVPAALHLRSVGPLELKEPIVVFLYLGEAPA